MTLRCEQVRAHLTELPEDSSVDVDASPQITSVSLDAHLADCAECHSLHVALREIDEDLGALPARDASDALVAATLARIVSADQEQNVIVDKPAEELGAGSIFLAAMASMVMGLGALLWAPFGAVAALLRGRGGSPVLQPDQPAQPTVGPGSADAAAHPEKDKPAARPPRLVWVLAPTFAACVVAVTVWTTSGALVRSPNMVGDGTLIDSLGGDDGRYRELPEEEIPEPVVRADVGGGEEGQAQGGQGWSIADRLSTLVFQDEDGEADTGERTTTLEGAPLHGSTVDGTTTRGPNGFFAADSPYEQDMAYGYDAEEVVAALLDTDGRRDSWRDPGDLGLDWQDPPAQDGYPAGSPTATPPPPAATRPTVSLPSGTHRVDLARVDVDQLAEGEAGNTEPAFEATIARSARTQDMGVEESDEMLRQEALIPPRDGADRSGASGLLEDSRRGERSGESRGRESSSAAMRWWYAQTETTGLRFASSDGWWANTYVPGDRAMRLLAQRLAGTAARSLPGVSVDALQLAEMAAPNEPALSAPTDTALALGVHADVTAVDGTRRVRVEVALRGIERAAGRRSPLRVAVVVDGRTTLDAEQAARVREVLAAIASARSPRDRVALYGAGPGGGELVTLGALAHGPVEVALRRFLPREPLGGRGTSLTEALRAASTAVAGDENVGLVLLLTPTGQHDASVDAALHTATLAGVTTSAIGLSSTTPLDTLDAIALLGQGRRRVVAGRADAAQAVRGELEAASRLVARAIRVRVRLAPGVRLVSVVGSRALDQLESTRTREVERSIDLEMASRLGIESDRDEDDDGIRILIPAFYAGTSHSMIFDLMVSGPGPVAEVDVRYKDLVRQGNGRASGALSVARGTARRGSRELRVVAAVLGHEVASALGEASAHAAAGDMASATARLSQARAAIDVARTEDPELARVPTLTADTQLLDRYLAALRAAPDSDLIATSLEYAARRRVVLPVSTLAAE